MTENIITKTDILELLATRMDSIQDALDLNPGNEDLTSRMKKIEDAYYLLLESL